MVGITAGGNEILTLSEVARRIQSALRQSLPDGFWLRAEIHKLNYYPQSGHCYPDLVEKAQNKISAQLRATIWAADFQRVNLKFKSVTKSPLSDNLVVLLWARIQFHAVFGLSLNILDIDPSYTLGVLEREKQACIQRLKNEQLFDLNRTLTIPLLPSRLAVISVSTSKGYHDFLGIMKSQGARFDIELDLFPAILQGDNAVGSILNALDAIRKDTSRYDAVLILRGGGGDAGLDCYNQYELAEKIASFPIPVLTGIGHSTNETVAEMVANQNLISPTDLAYFILRKFTEFENRLLDVEMFMKTSPSDLLESELQYLHSRSLSLSALIINALQSEESTIASLGKSLRREFPRLLMREEQRLSNSGAVILQASSRALLHRKAGIFRIENIIQPITKRNIAVHKQKFESLERNLNLLDPQRVLARGYSITRAGGKAVTHANSLQKGEIITTSLHQGSILSRIDTINE